MTRRDVLADYEVAAANRMGRRHAIAFGFARHAITALLSAAGLEPGDEILVAPLTCKVVPLSILAAGFRPVYGDVSAATLNLDASRIGAAAGSRTRAILFQHTYGSGRGLDEVAREADRRGLLLLEDCAQCMPVDDDGYRPGRTGYSAVFSNNLLKPLPAGSGGLAVTDDDALAARVRAARDRLPERTAWQSGLLRGHHWLHRRLVGPRTYWPLLHVYQRLGSNYRDLPLDRDIAAQVTDVGVRPSAFQYADGRRWMAHLDALVRHRRLVVDSYRGALGSGGAGFSVPHDIESGPLLYFPVLSHRKRELLSAAMRQRLQIVAWPGLTPMYPVERMETLRTYGYEPGTCPVAESLAARLVGLPTDIEITPALRHRIADLVTGSATA